MAGYRKLGRTSSQRKAMLRSLVTALLFNGKIVTTEARAKEVKKIAEGLIALAVKEKDNFETVKVTAKVARKDENGKRVKEVVDGKFLRDCSVENCLEIAFDGSQRRAEIVRYVRDEIVLVLFHFI